MAETKIHVGLIANDKNLEAQLKDATQSSGGGYVHSAKSMVEMYQKLGMQKVGLMVYLAEDGDNGTNSQALVQFFRSKKDYKELPILILTPTQEVRMKKLINDPRVRGFPMLGGLFTPILTMRPLTTGTTTSANLTLDIERIQYEFIQSIKEKLGQGLEFTAARANDDETHSAFFCQHSDEIRSHLGWFKFAARILEGNNDGMKKIFAGMDADMMEELALNLLTKIVEDFKSRIYADLTSRGAIFFPPMEELDPAERKQLYGSSKSQPVIFKANEMTVLLEVIQYI